MRATTTLLLCGLLTLGSVAGCAEVSGAADKASICVDALKLAGFTPNLSDPAKAAADAERTSRELSELADKAADTTLRDALEGMADKVGELDVRDLDPSTATRWAQEKATTLDTLTRACT